MKTLEITEQELKEIEQELAPTPPRLKVWYGLRKLTEKIVRRKSICIAYENAYYWKTPRQIKQMMHVFFERDQTEAEKQDAVNSSRTLSVYEYFLDDKKYKGDIEKVIQGVMAGDKNIVTEETLQLIEDKIRQKIKEIDYI